VTTPLDSAALAGLDVLVISNALGDTADVAVPVRAALIDDDTAAVKACQLKPTPPVAASAAGRAVA
jgi:hypothetical protein